MASSRGEPAEAGCRGGLAGIVERIVGPRLLASISQEELERFNPYAAATANQANSD